MPKVSIIVPSYNHGAYVGRRLESIYGQTFRDCEVILLDDASTDDSRAILEAFPKTLPTRSFFNEANTGSPFVQWAKGLGLATGEYVWIAETDDVCEPGFLERMVAELDADPGVGLAYCQSRVIDQDGADRGIYTETVDVRHAARYRADFRNGGRDECARFLIRGGFIPNSSAVLFRRRLTEGIEPLLTSMRYVGDWLLYLRILTRGDMKFVAEPLNSYRHHPGNQSRSAAAAVLSVQEWMRGVKWLVGEVPLPRSALDLAANEYLHHWNRLRATAPLSWGQALRRLGGFRRETGLPWAVLPPALARFAAQWWGAARLQARRGAAASSGR